MCLLFVYIGNFCHNGISGQNSDWGDFATYMGMGTGLISVFLLYATFVEQRRTNNLEILDKHFYNACGIISKMQENYKSVIDEDENRLSEEFRLGIGDGAVKLDKSSCRQRIQTGYHNIQKSKADIAEYTNLFSYIIQQLEYINSGIQSDKTKIGYSMELLSILNVKTKILFVAFLLQGRTQMLDCLNKEGALKFGMQDVGYDDGYRFYINVLRVACGDKPLPQIDYKDSEIDREAILEQAKKQ